MRYGWQLTLANKRRFRAARSNTPQILWLRASYENRHPIKFTAASAIPMQQTIAANTRFDFSFSKANIRSATIINTTGNIRDHRPSKGQTRVNQNCTETGSHLTHVRTRG